MIVLQRVAFAFVITYVLIDAFVPNGPHLQKLYTSYIVAISRAYMLDVHGMCYKKVKSFF